MITVNYFVQFLRQAALTFRDATGTFYNDRWKPLFEGLLNVVLSITAVKILSRLGGDELGVVGVIAATVVTNLTICHIIEPYVLYKHAFHISSRKHLFKNYAYVAVFIAALTVTSVLMRRIDNRWLSLLINGSVSLAVSAIVLIITFALDKETRKSLRLKRTGG